MKRAVAVVLLLALSTLPWLRADDVPGALRVAVYDDAGKGASFPVLLQVLAADPGLQVRRLKAEEIRAGGLSGCDVLLQPGGTGGTQGKTLGSEGRERVRTFVSNGGGYVGICAGAYLATRDYTWSLHILDAKVIDKAHWARGFGPVDLALTERGRQLLGVKAERPTIYYHQGPLLAPADDPDIPDYESLATFAGEIAERGAPKGVMPGTTAIAAGTFGKGRVLCFSPHPERTEGLQGMVSRGLRWAAAR